MTNWNIENSECLKDCENIDNNLLENEDKPFETIVKDEINTENFRDRRRGRARRIGDTQYIGYGRPRHRSRFFPSLYRDPVIVNRSPVIVRRDSVIVEKPVVQRDPEMHFGVEKLVMLLIILVMFIVGGIFLLRKN